MAKITYRIPTSQFAFIEIAEEEPVNGLYSSQQIVSRFNELEKAYKDSLIEAPGLPEKEFDRFIQTQLEGGQNHVEVYNLMSPEQQKAVQAYKRALNRIKAKGMRAMSGAPEDLEEEVNLE